MPVVRFPDPRSATTDGIVALGGDLQVETLLLAYRQGIFPWPMHGLPLTWVCPLMRAVLNFEELHIPRSLAKERARSTFTFTIDRDFPAVIEACAQASRPDQPGTWITGRMLRAYNRFHERGYAHSVEVWDGEELVGGLYGVAVDGAFAGESMFHRRPNASKLALLFLIDHLKERGLDWIDIQMMTPHMEILGAREIPRLEFLDKLSATHRRNLKLFDSQPPASARTADTDGGLQAETSPKSRKHSS